MLLIELTTLTTSSRLKNLGVKISDDDYIQINSFIDIGKITHLTENPDDKSITNIYLTNGAVLHTDIPIYLEAESPLSVFLYENPLILYFVLEDHQEHYCFLQSINEVDLQMNYYLQN